MRNMARIMAALWAAAGIGFARADQPSASQPASRPAAESTSRPAELTAEQLAQLRKHIADLGSVKFEAREGAAAAIRAMGVVALPEVLNHTNDADAEVADQCERIAQFLDLMIPARADQLDLKLTMHTQDIKTGQRLQFMAQIFNNAGKPVLIPGYTNNSTETLLTMLQVTDPDGHRVEGFLARPAAANAQAVIVQPYQQQYMHLMFTIAKDLPSGTGAASRPSAEAYLAMQDRILHYPLAKPGRYSLKLVLDPAKLPAEAKKQATASGRTVLPDGSVSTQQALPFTGVLASDVATFEVPK